MTHPSFSLVLVSDEAHPHLQACARLHQLALHVIDYPGWLSQPDLLQSTAQPVLLLGPCASPVAVDRMLKQVWQQVSDDVPVITAGLADAELAGLEDHERAMLVGDLPQDFHFSDLTSLLHRAQTARLMRKQGQVFSEVVTGLIGMSASIRQVRAMVHQVASRDVSVLITGESGTGKEVVARSLHDQSSRRDGPFVPINCGAIPAELLESELFGHEKGAFTGAVSSRAGRFELARGGTLFLDEIGDMPLNMQVKLLRVIQERQFERVGGTRTLDADVRIITATHKHLEEMIEAGEFREDLYFRLNVFPIEMAPLRERTEDIPLLLDEMVRRTDEQGLGKVLFHPSALESLALHPWPGNVRELSNLVERLVIMYPDGVVGVSELPEKFRHIPEPDPALYAASESQIPQVQSPQVQGAVVNVSSPQVSAVAGTELLPEGGINLKSFLEEQEQKLIGQALDKCDGVVARAAELLQVRRTTLVEKMRKYGMQRK